MSKRACEAVGIDLGTTYSTLAYLDSQLVPCVVPDSSGHTVVPSVIYFDGSTVIVGDTALDMSKEHSERAVQFVKVHMGEEWRFQIDGQVHTPESLSAMILAHLVRESETQIGAIRQAVITVPAWFTEKRRRATEQAGRIAGLEVIGTLNEPMAAALAYGLHRLDDLQGGGRAGRHVMVYDLGGGTFDVTVMRVTPTELVELATRGNRKLGGKDWDEALMKLALDDFQKKLGVDLRQRPDAGKALHDLRLECERAKRRLSQAAKTTVPVRALGHDHPFEVSRADFESATAGLLQSTRMTVETALEDAGLEWPQIDRVVLVGGSTHMPMVRQMLQSAAGKAPDRGINPVTAVGLGAAIYAYLLQTGTGPKAVRLDKGDQTLPPPPAPPAGRNGSADRPEVRFVTAHGVGVQTKGPGGWCNTVLIPKNTQVPASVSRVFRTSLAPGATAASKIRVVVTQGDTPKADLAEVLGTASIAGIPANEPAGQPVEITLSFDQQSRLHLHALYLKSGQRLTLDLVIPGGLREEEVRHYHELLVTSGLVPKVRGAEPEIISLEDDSDLNDEEDDPDIPLLDPVD